MASRSERPGRRVPSPEGALRDARWSLLEALGHLNVVAERAPKPLVRSDARIAITSIQALLRDVLKENDET